MQVEDQGPVMTQGDGVMDNPQFFRKTAGGFFSVRGLKAYHAGKIFHLAFCKIVLRMGRKTGVDYFYHPEVCFKPAGRFEGVFFMGLHAERQGRKAAHDKPCVEGA